MIKRIVVTGATSMIASTLIDYAVKKNIEILALCRKGSTKINNISKNQKIKMIFINLNELDNLLVEDEKKYDVFFHFGWDATMGSGRDDANLQMANIQYTLDAVKLAKQLGCHTFVGAGSQAEYGRTTVQLSDVTPTNPETGYGIAKYTAGKLSALYAKELGIKHVWARILSVYGPRDNENTLIMYTINKLLDGEVPTFTPCEQLWDYIHCEDAARAIYLIAERGQDQGIYCIGSGQAQPLSEYLYTIRNEIDMNLELGIGQRVYGPNQVMYLCADIEKLTQDTGFIPQVNFKEGIIQTIRYCKNKRRIIND